MCAAGAPALRLPAPPAQGFCNEEAASGAAARPRADCVRWCKHPLT